MQKEFQCDNCLVEIIITIYNLFFSEKPRNVKAICPCCKKFIQEFETDGWIYVRTKSNFLKE